MNQNDVTLSLFPGLLKAMDMLIEANKLRVASFNRLMEDDARQATTDIESKINKEVHDGQ